jgi:ribose transport system substrate-binding protein
MKLEIDRAVTGFARARRTSLLALIVAVAVTLAALAAAGAAAGIQGREAQTKIYFIVPELANPFWVPGKKGAQDAAKKYGVDLHITGTPQFDAHQQINLLQDAETAGAQGIVVVPGDPTTLNNEIAKAVGKKIYVGAAILDAPKSKRQFFVGPGVVQEGRTEGQRVLAALKRQGATGQVQAVITTCLPGSSGQEGRRKGFTLAVTKENPYKSKFQVKIVAYVNATGEPAKSLAAHQNLLLAHPDVKVIYPMCAISTQNAGQAVKAKNRHDIIIAGHDWLPETLNLIQQGWIAWSLGEDPYGNLYNAVKWLALAAQGKKPVPHGAFISKSIIATKANLAQIRKSPNASGG